MMKPFHLTLIALAIGTASLPSAKGADSQSPLTDAGLKLEAEYATMLGQLRTELPARLPDAAKADPVKAFLVSDALDAKLAKFVVLQPTAR